MLTVPPQISSIFGAIGAAIMAVVGAIATAVKAVINAIVSLFSIVISCLTCGAVGRRRRTVSHV